MKIRDLRIRLQQVAFHEGIDEIPGSLATILDDIVKEGIDAEEDAQTHIERFLANPHAFPLDPVKVVEFIKEKQGELVAANTRVEQLEEQVIDVTAALEAVPIGKVPPILP